MIRRFINFIKVDYRNVYFALKMLSNNRLPTWVIVLYYSMLAPICLLLYYPVKWICDYYVRGLIKDVEKGV